MSLTTPQERLDNRRVRLSTNKEEGVAVGFSGGSRAYSGWMVKARFDNNESYYWPETLEYFIDGAFVSLAEFSKLINIKSR